MRGWATTDNLRSLLGGARSARVATRAQRALRRSCWPPRASEACPPSASARRRRAISPTCPIHAPRRRCCAPRATSARIQFPLSDLDAEGLVVSERIDQFLAERPELKEAVDRLPYTEEDEAAEPEPADDRPPNSQLSRRAARPGRFPQPAQGQRRPRQRQAAPVFSASPSRCSPRPRRRNARSLLDVGERQLAIGVGDVLHLIETRQSVTHM